MRKHLTIPECRSLLRLIASTTDKVTARRIRFVIGHMKRRAPVRTTRVKSPPMTSAMKTLARKLARTTDMNQMQIGTHLGVSSGRVSEALAGKRR